MNFEDIAGASIDITQEFVVELVDHAVVTPPKSKVCELCGKIFISGSTLQSHLKTIHENIKEFSCQICSKSFSTRYKLNRHKTSHSNVKNFACECGKTFKSRDPFLKHQRIHETGNETFFCSICFLEFKYRSGFNYHNQMKHHKRPPPTKITQKNASKDSEHTCEECLKVLPNKYSYNRHKSVHAPRSFACEQCGVKFKAPYDLQKHQKVHETLYFRCRACPRFFKEQKVLDVHMSHHSKKKLEKIQKEDEKKLAEIQKENEQKLAAENAELLEILDIIEENGLGPLEMTAEEQNKIIIESIEILPPIIRESPVKIQEPPKIVYEMICEICGAGFHASCDLNKHTHRVHQKEAYRYICDKCPHRFPTLYDLNRHLTKHKTEKLYQCDHCGVKMKVKSSVIQHMRDIHLKDHTKICFFYCGVCGRKYKEARYLEVHARTHVMDKRFNCLLCDELFFYKDAVKWHNIKKHKQEPPFSCSICQRVFLYQKSMDAHLKTHREGNKFSICPICGVKILESRNLKRHLRIHAEKSLKCNYCPLKFREKHQLSKHQKTHAKEIESFEVVDEIMDENAD